MGAAGGRLDGLVFMVGIIVGILGFAEIYPAIVDFAWSGARGTETLPELLGASPSVVAVLIAAMALALFWLAGAAEKKFGDSSPN